MIVRKECMLLHQAINSKYWCVEIHDDCRITISWGWLTSLFPFQLEYGNRSITCASIQTAHNAVNLWVERKKQLGYQTEDQSK